jgi:O-antigen/teichoic acid export membrane protein
MPKKKLKELKERNKLLINSLHSFLGYILPILVGIATTPLLINGLGKERFGILALIWMIIGYFSIFDLGLGRALTQLVAERIGKGNLEDVPSVFWTATLLMLLLGLLGSITLTILSPWLIYSVLKIPPYLQQETLKACLLLACSLPIITSSTGFIGFLSAFQKYELINLIKIPLGILMFMGPLGVINYKQDLFIIAIVLLSIRFCSWIYSFIWCVRIFPQLGPSIKFSREQIANLIGFGSCFVIGTFSSMTAVTYYVTPYDAITKLWIIPTAIVNVLFPEFSTRHAAGNIESKSLLRNSIKYSIILIFPIGIIIISQADLLLYLWLGSDFSKKSNLILQILTISVCINSLAYFPFTFLQGIGKPKVTAKIHILEFPIYFITLLIFMKYWGIHGAALAWLLRGILDNILLFFTCNSYNKDPFLLKNVFIFSTFFGIISFSIIAIGKLFDRVEINLLMMAFSEILFFILVWRVLLNAEEKKKIILSTRRR